VSQNSKIDFMPAKLIQGTVNKETVERFVYMADKRQCYILYSMHIVKEFITKNIFIKSTFEKFSHQGLNAVCLPWPEKKKYCKKSLGQRKNKNKKNLQSLNRTVVMVATRPLPRDGGVEELHEDPTVGPHPKVWTRGQKWKECQRRRAGETN